MSVESITIKTVDLDSDLNEELKKYFKRDKHNGFIRIGEKGYLFSNNRPQDIQKIYNMEIRTDDIFVISIPRSGTTWVQELVWLVANDLKYADAPTTPASNKYTFLEYALRFPPNHWEELCDETHKVNNIIATCIENIASFPSPRFIKTHLPYSVLPPTLLDKAKTVYIARDPRDVAVSFYHLSKYFNSYSGDFKTFWNFFIKDLIIWTPFFEHVKEAWEKRHHPNVLFLFYEELKKDLPAVIYKAFNFFEKKRPDDDEISYLIKHLGIENFRKMDFKEEKLAKDLGRVQSNEQPFIRKGKVGEWRKYFDEDMIREADLWIANNLRDTDLRFPEPC